MLYVGEGSEREQWRLLHSVPVFSHSPRYPPSNWAFLVLLPKWVGCVHSRPLWVSPTKSPVSLGVSPAAASTPTGVFNQLFEALFPHTGALGCAVCHLVHQLLPCHESSLSSCLSPPLLQVWMNVSSLSPWLSDFHTVQFSVSSGCFLFLNCCCSSFGCVKRHSLFTYASILARSQSVVLK